MTPIEMQIILDKVGYPGYIFEVKQKNDVPYLQARYMEPDIITGLAEWQYTRKWLLSEHMVTSEIVQTAFKCVLTSAEHRVRENFLYRGERVYGPHFDVDALHDIAKKRRLDYRGKAKATSAGSGDNKASQSYGDSNQIICNHCYMILSAPNAQHSCDGDETL